MGFNLTAAALMRVRHHGGFSTIWGWLLSGLAVIVFFFGRDERRHNDDEETAERRARKSYVSLVIAGILTALAIIVDTIAANL